MMGMLNDLPVYYVGWVGSVSENMPLLWRPHAPKSYTKAESINAWIEEHRADAAIQPYVGTMSTACVLDGSRASVYSGPSPSTLYGVLNNLGRFDTMGAFDHECKPQAVFVGFNVKQLFQSIARELMLESVRVPFRFWQSTPGLIDIHDLLIPGDLRNGFDLGSLLQYLGPNWIPAPYDQMAGPGNAVLSTAEDRAIVAYHLAMYAQLR